MTTATMQKGRILMTHNCYSVTKKSNRSIVFLFLFIMTTSLTPAQYKPTPNDTLTSVTVLSDGRVTFRLYAPNAADVHFGGGDIPEALRSQKMTKRNDGVWEATIGPIVPGAYRYNFNVDGISVMDPRNPRVSESNDNAWSLMYVPGAGIMEEKNVPHGAVVEVTYFSTTLGRSRRMHVYTPPGAINFPSSICSMARTTVMMHGRQWAVRDSFSIT